MRFTSVSQALYELHNMMHGFKHGTRANELQVVNSKATMSASQIKGTATNDDGSPTSIINRIKAECTLRQRYFINYFYGYEDLFGCDDSLKYLAQDMTGTYELNRCYLLYYRDKCKREDLYRSLAHEVKISYRTAQDWLHDKKSIKRLILDQLLNTITNEADYQLAHKINKILLKNELIKLDI